MTGADLSIHQLLGRSWLDRRARSTRPFGADLAPELRADLERAILSHPQFTA